MPGLISGKKRFTEQDMFFSLGNHDTLPRSKSNPHLPIHVSDDFDSPLLPGLPDDVAKYCLALVPRSNFPAMGCVCRKWRSFMQSKELITVRKLAGVLEEWLYILTMDVEGKESHWEVLDSSGLKHHHLPPMPGAMRAGFGVVVLNGKLLVMAGYLVVKGTGPASADVYQYDSCLNRFVLLSCFQFKASKFYVLLIQKSQLVGTTNLDKLSSCYLD